VPPRRHPEGPDDVQQGVGSVTGDAWAIVAYLRALQRSQGAAFEDLQAARGIGRAEQRLNIRGLSRFLATIESSIPDDWRWTRIMMGPVAPKDWPEGHGIQIRIAPRDAIEAGREPTPMISITVMDADYDAVRPLPVVHAEGDAAAELIGQWNARGVYLGTWDGAKPWPALRTDLERAMAIEAD